MESIEDKAGLLLENIVFKSHDRTSLKAQNKEAILKFSRWFNELSTTDKNRAVAAVESISTRDIDLRAFVLTFCLRQTSQATYYSQIMDLCLDLTLDLHSRWYLYWQAIYYKFTRKLQGDITTDDTDAYTSILKTFLQNFHLPEKPCPDNVRTKDYVIVLTNQFLALQHAPTYITLEICDTLVKQLGKKVFLINAASMAREKDEQITVFDPHAATCLDYYSADGTNKKIKLTLDNISQWTTDRNGVFVEHKEMQYPFYQIKDIFNQEEMQNLLQVVINQPPELIVAIGDSNPCADLFAHHVPTAVFPCGYSLPQCRN
ncbi:MAG: hypothetical protein QGI45_00470, partial [Myxococcota bacterium]|nr:hypothetical protein [Myxococcota bacterium]